MPKYEYACKSCGERIEVVQSFADEPLSECAACGGPLRKVFSAPSIAFKGSGFYRTDNRKRRQEQSADTKTEKSPADAKADTKTDTKTDSKSEPAKADTGSKTETKAEPKPKTEAKTA
jgi:putative FmdB family regulatory protein